MTAEIIAGINFLSRHIAELKAAGDAYLTTRSDADLDKLVDCIKRLPPIRNAPKQPSSLGRDVL